MCCIFCSRGIAKALFGTHGYLLLDCDHRIPIVTKSILRLGTTVVLRVFCGSLDASCEM